MAPTEILVEWQTSEIVRFLLEDPEENEKFRQLNALETDGPTECCADEFDAVGIAEKLRSVADALNDDIKFKDVLSDLKQAAAQEAAEAAFSHGVEVLCQTPVLQAAEVVSEMQVIRASVAFGLYLTKSSPELKNKIHSAMTAFLNRRVGTWVTKQGGWDKLNV